jgi:dynein heavy chain
VFIPSGTRLSLDAIKRRLQIFNKYSKDADKMDSKPPLFRADIVLAIPNVVMKPSLEDLQSALNKAVQLILKTSQDIPQWEHLIFHQKQQQKVALLTVCNGVCGRVAEVKCIGKHSIIVFL